MTKDDLLKEARDKIIQLVENLEINAQGRSTAKDLADRITATLSAPSPSSVEVGTYIVAVNDTFCTYEYTLEGSGEYSIANIIAAIEKNTTLRVSQSRLIRKPTASLIDGMKILSRKLILDMFTATHPVSMSKETNWPAFWETVTKQALAHGYTVEKE